MVRGSRFLMYYSKIIGTKLRIGRNIGQKMKLVQFDHKAFRDTSCLNFNLRVEIKSTCSVCKINLFFADILWSFIFLRSQMKGNKDKDFWKKLEYALEHGLIFQNVCMRLPVSLLKFISNFFAGNSKNFKK